ncbi:hypothetical protein JOS77_19515 [Chromobacterium haemolyticum]|nr:hypothetical protein JOS77_19515 [Chromobacterium haemolyticum]
MLMHKEQASLLVVDIQEKLAPAVVDAAGMAARCRWLIGVAADHGLPVVFFPSNTRAAWGIPCRNCSPKRPTRTW